MNVDKANPAWCNCTAVGTMDVITAAELVEKGGVSTMVNPVIIHYCDAPVPFGWAGDCHLTGRNCSTCDNKVLPS